MLLYVHILYTLHVCIIYSIVLDSWNGVCVICTSVFFCKNLDEKLCTHNEVAQLYTKNKQHAHIIDNKYTNIDMYMQSHIHSDMAYTRMQALSDLLTMKNMYTYAHIHTYAYVGYHACMCI